MSLGARCLAIVDAMLSWLPTDPTLTNFNNGIRPRRQPDAGDPCGGKEGVMRMEAQQSVAAPVPGRNQGGISFSAALFALKDGARIARAGWNGKGMYLALQEGSTIPAEHARGGAAKGRAAEGATEIQILPHIDMRAADGSIVVGWLASQTDLLSDDWQILP